jgi:ABC-2 type transport system permease protein
MTGQGVVYDLGYTPYEGEKLGRRGAITTTYRDGNYRVLGIKRRARRKILPWLLAAFAMIPAVVFVGLAFLTGNFVPDAESPYGGHGQYFVIVGTIVLLFCALAAPELLIPDRKEGVLSIYSSRPMLPDDYVGARFASLLTVVAGFLVIPHVLMYIGFAGLDEAGFFQALWNNADDIPKILGSTAAFALGYAPLALLVATFANRKAAATGVYLGLILVGAALVSAIVTATTVPGRRYAALLSVVEHPVHVNDWIWGSSSDLQVANQGFDPWVSLAVIIGLAVVSGLIMVWRYRRLM